MEIIITVGLVALAIYILVKNIKGKKSGGCNCSGSCSAKCPMYNKKTS